MARPYKDYTGMKFGYLTAVKPIERKGKKTVWLWKCDCGNEVINYAGNVANGATISCGHVLESRKIGPLQVLINHNYTRYLSRGLTLDKEAFTKITLDKCAYCGKYPEKNKTNGIDKINPQLGYVDGNMVCSCWECNKMKSNMKQQNFIDHVKRIAMYLQSK